MNTPFKTSMFDSLSYIKAFAKRRNLPIIPIFADKIELIHKPSQYYQHLLSRVQASEDRVGISALYLGTGPKERQLVEALFDKLSKNSSFTSRILLDRHRASRTNPDGDSSVVLLHPLRTFPSFSYSLVKTAHNYYVLGRIQKWNEIRSTYHGKFCVFDRDILISGANISDIYFERRQDRYMVVKDSEVLSNYMFELLRTLSGETESISSALHKQNIKYSCLTGESGQEPSNDTFVIPIIQHGPSNLTDLDDFLCLVNKNSDTCEKYLSTGYFNPGEVTSLIGFKSILVPSEEANGFYGGKGLLSHVPKLYTSICKTYANQHDTCQVNLYNRSGWSFHGKGLWIRDTHKPYIHVVGSSNFNLRSSKRDLEIQLIVITTNKQLVSTFEEERESLWNYSKKLSNVGLVGYRYILPLVKSFL